MAIPLFLLIGKVEDDAGIAIGLLTLDVGSLVGGGAALALLKEQRNRKTA